MKGVIMANIMTHAKDDEYEETETRSLKIPFADGQRGFCSTKKFRFSPDSNSVVKLSLQDSINERYSKSVIINTVDGVESYGTYRYVDDEKSAKETGKYFPVAIDEIYEILQRNPDQKMKIAETAREWMGLSKRGKSDLHRILQFPKHVWSQLEFSGGKWKQRICLGGDADCTALEYYYPKDGERQLTYFADYVIAGLTQAEIEPVDHLSLADSWTIALYGELNNGDGRTAVYQLFKELAALLPHMKITAPVRVLHKTKTSNHDSFLVADTDNSSSNGKGKSVQSHKQSVDIVVVTKDPNSGFSKCICLVEVHSKGKAYKEAENQFLKEIIWALQAQNIVFGFLFSTSTVKYYCAERLPCGKVRIEKYTYVLTYSTSGSAFHVGSFQMLLMDILACLVFGVKHIEV